MSPQSRLVAGLVLIIVPTVEIGGASILSLLIGGLLELFGLHLYMIHFVPGGLFELVFPIWLIVKGFQQSAVASKQGAGNSFG